MLPDGRELTFNEREIVLAAIDDRIAYLHELEGDQLADNEIEERTVTLMDMKHLEDAKEKLCNPNPSL